MSVPSVNVMDGDSRGSCLWFSRAQWQDAFFYRGKTKKEKKNKSSRVGLLSEESKRNAAQHFEPSPRSSSSQIQAANSHQHHCLDHHDHYRCHRLYG